MMKTNKALATVAIGAAGIMALGACSSGANDQAQVSNSPASDHSTVPANEREAAKSDHKGFVTMPTLKGSPYSKVVVTHNPSAKCTQKETKEHLEINCTNVGYNYFGDAIYVRVPSKQWMVIATNLDYNVKADMRSTQRDHAAFPIAYYWSDKKEHSWYAPKIWTAGSGWGVGMESTDNSRPIAIRILVAQDY